VVDSQLDLELDLSMFLETTSIAKIGYTQQSGKNALFRWLVHVSNVMLHDFREEAAIIAVNPSHWADNYDVKKLEEYLCYIEFQLKQFK
jgi:hypothetical protein